MQVKIRKYMHVEEIRGVYVCGGDKRSIRVWRRKTKRKKEKKN